MVFNKRDWEGYLMIDHRESPGITPEQAAAGPPGTIPVGKGMLFQAPTVNCSHCTRLIVLNPARIRDRAYCPKCDYYICDACEAVRVQTGVCKPFKQVIAEFVDAAAKGQI